MNCFDSFPWLCASKKPHLKLIVGSYSWLAQQSNCLPELNCVARWERASCVLHLLICQFVSSRLVSITLHANAIILATLCYDCELINRPWPSVQTNCSIRSLVDMANCNCRLLPMLTGNAHSDNVDHWRIREWLKSRARAPETHVPPGERPSANHHCVTWRFVPFGSNVA